MKRLLPLLFVVFWSTAGQAQRDTTRVQAAFKVVLNFDARRTWVNDASVRFNGIRLGAQRGRDLIAIGFYGLGDPYIQPSVDLGPLGKQEFYTRFSYAALTYERLLIDTKRWQAGIPVAFGLGNYRTSYRDTLSGNEIAYGVNELVPIEATLHADYNIFWFVFVGAGAGYRYVLAADPEATRKLSDYTYYFKVGLRFGEVVKRVRKRLRDDI